MEFSFKPGDINISIRQVEQFIGYREGESHDHISSLISELLAESHDLCDLRAEYRIFDKPLFDHADNIIEIDGTRFAVGKIILGQVKKSESMALFLATAGKGVGERSREYMASGDPLKGYIMDAIGSELAEAVADRMQEHLARNAGSLGKNITNRFSPGYCGWDVSEQHKLFSLLPGVHCGITLTPSALMDPVKSVSGIIGIGEKVKARPYTCSFCDMKDCIYRRKA